jgi:hypothetical protein
MMTGGLRTEGGTSFPSILSSDLRTGLIRSGNYVEIMKANLRKTRSTLDFPNGRIETQ